LSDDVEDMVVWRRMKRKPGGQGKPLEDVWLRLTNSGKWLDPESGVERDSGEWARDYVWCASDDLPHDDEDDISPVTRPATR
jgi:hypothetical protein